MRFQVLLVVPLLTIIAADVMSWQPSDNASVGRSNVSRDQERCVQADEPGIIELFQQWACVDEQVAARVKGK